MRAMVRAFVVTVLCGVVFAPVLASEQAPQAAPTWPGAPLPTWVIPSSGVTGGGQVTTACVTFPLGTQVCEDAARVLSQRNGSSAPERWNVANTYTSSTNHELFSVDWQTTANAALIGTRTAATGTGRTAAFISQGSSATDNYSGLLTNRAAGISGIAGTPFIALGHFNAAGGAGTTSITATQVALGFGINTATSGTLATVSIIPTYNQASGTAANTDLLINRTETAVGSGEQNFIQAQVGGSARFSVRSSGSVNSTSSIHAFSGTAMPAGGTTGFGIRLSSTANFGIFFGSGAPTLSAAQGSLYLRSDGSTTSTRLYVNTNGTTGWTPVTTGT